MQTPRFSHIVSFGLATLMTLIVLVGIDHQAQVPTTSPLLAQATETQA
jgi:hypothetical protein